MLRTLNNVFKYPVAKLLEALKQNRIKHLEDYEEAVKNYKDLLEQELEAMLALAKEGGDVGHRINLKKPECYVKQYDQAIAMFEMTSDTEIEIDGQTFARLVMDEWEWQDSFTNNTKVYSVHNLARPGAYSNVRI